jgi:glycine cleavage system aminomethyltransferase T
MNLDRDVAAAGRLTARRRRVRIYTTRSAIIDVSNARQILVEGPDAGRASRAPLTRNRFGDLKTGRIRYGVLTTDGGRIMDDGTVARLRRRALLTSQTTSTGSDSVCEWFEWWNAIWGYDAEIVNVTARARGREPRGPRARRGARRS